MQCPRCRHENHCDAKFCNECGGPLKTIDPSSPPPPSYPEIAGTLTEALEQHAATVEVLRLISQSPTDVQPVFGAIAEHALRLCRAKQGLVVTFDGELLHLSAVAHIEAEGVELLRSGFPTRPDRGTVIGRAVLMKATVHVPSVLDDPEYAKVAFAKITGFRSGLAVPMRRNGNVIGAIGVGRVVGGPFSDREIALLQTFADQAVIAIENVRLFKELEGRNRDVTTALDRQTATSEILRVISSSPTDVQPVFDAILRSGVTLCDAVFGAVFRLEGDLVYLVGIQHPTPEVVAALYPAPVTAPLPPCRALRDNAIIHVLDTEEEGAQWPEVRRVARLSGQRRLLIVPMRREGGPIGAILVARPVVGRFPDDHIALLQTFADQAVIAIENVRLFTELEARNKDLAEALEQQTATSEILRVISRSPTDVQPVFETILERAVALCGARNGSLFRFDGELVHVAAHFNLPSTVVEIIARQ